MKFPNPVEMAQALVSERLAEGDVAVDATAGNGHDTVFLAGCAGEFGRVYAFDIQAAALESTRRRLAEVGLLGRVRLVEADHGAMEDHLGKEDLGKVGAVMFNLGYLPGGEKTVVTRPESTLKGIRAALEVLGPDGVVTVVVYTGHAGGGAEAEEIENWISNRMPEGIEAIRYSPLGREAPPYLIAFRRRADR